MDFQQTTRAASWLWNGIRKCYGSLRNRICIWVGPNSSTRIYGDPWIPGLPNFTMPMDVPILENVTFVRDLMSPDTTAWNVNLIAASFLSNVSNAILSIPLADREHDEYVWAPSLSGTFSVRSSYRINNIARFGLFYMERKWKWKAVWQSELHERHKLLMWRVLGDILPTRARIRQFVPLLDISCLLCGGDTETTNHLLFVCPVTHLCWLNSPWNIRIQECSNSTVEEWIMEVLEKRSMIQNPLDDEEQTKLI